MGFDTSAWGLASGQGWEAFDEEKKRREDARKAAQEARESGNSGYRRDRSVYLYRDDGSGNDKNRAVLTFLDALSVVEPLSFSEHQFSTSNSKHNWVTCPEEMFSFLRKMKKGGVSINGESVSTLEGLEASQFFADSQIALIKAWWEVPEEKLVCPKCAGGNKPRFVMPFSVIDNKGYTSKRGTNVVDFPRLVVYNLYGVEQLRSMMRDTETDGDVTSEQARNLRGMKLRFSRSGGEKSLTTGDSWKYLSYFEEDRLFEEFGFVRELPDDLASEKDEDAVRAWVVEKFCPALYRKKGFPMSVLVDWGNKKVKHTPMPADYLSLFSVPMPDDFDRVCTHGHDYGWGTGSSSSFVADATSHHPAVSEDIPF